MSVYKQYAEAVRTTRANVDQFVDATTYGAKKYADQAREATTAGREFAGDVVDYLTRVVELQGGVNKQLAAISAEYATSVLQQCESLAEATREYATAAEQILRDQTAAHNEEYARVAERATSALAATISAPASKASKTSRAAKAAA